MSAEDPEERGRIARSRAELRAERSSNGETSQSGRIARSRADPRDERGSNGEASQGRSLTDLVRELLRAVFGLVRSTARMAGLEAREIAERLGRRIALLVGSVVIGAAGAVVFLGGLAFLAERALGLPRWAGFTLVGLVAAAAGALGVRSALRRLSDPDLAFPQTLAELAKDADALTTPRREP